MTARIYEAKFGLEALSSVIRDADCVTTYGHELADYRLPNPVQQSVQLALLAGECDPLLRDRSISGRTERIAALDTAIAERKSALEAVGFSREVTLIDLKERSGIVDYSPEDQVVTVRAGTRLWDLQQELKRHGQTLPYPSVALTGLQLASIPENLMICHLVEFNLPHGLEAQCGSWRDWILGAAIFRPDGSIARCGSRVVKNVAGYDVHKLLVGSRGTLALSIEFVFRTYPINSLPQTETRKVRSRSNEDPGSLWIQRVLPSDWESAVSDSPDQLLELDPASGTLWAAVAPDATRRRFRNDWLLRTGCGIENCTITSRDLAQAMHATKQRLDPTDKFNPGEFGLGEVQP